MTEKDNFVEDELSNFFAQYQESEDDDDDFRIPDTLNTNITPPKIKKNLSNNFLLPNDDEPYNFSKQELNLEVEGLKDDNENFLYSQFLAGVFSDPSQQTSSRKRKSKNFFEDDDDMDFHINDNIDDFDNFNDSNDNINGLSDNVLNNNVYKDDEIDSEELLSLIEDTRSNFIKPTPIKHNNNIEDDEDEDEVPFVCGNPSVVIEDDVHLSDEQIENVKLQIRKFFQINLFLYLQVRYSRLKKKWKEDIKSDLKSLEEKKNENEKIIKSNLVYFLNADSVITRSKISQCKSVISNSLEMEPEIKIVTVRNKENGTVHRTQRKVSKNAFQKLDEFYDVVNTLQKDDFEKNDGKVVKDHLVRIFGENNMINNGDSDSGIFNNIGNFGINFTTDPMSTFRKRQRIGKTKFSHTEDELVVMGMKRHGKRWDKIRENYLPSKNAKQIQIRYKNKSCAKAKDTNPIRMYKMSMEKKYGIKYKKRKNSHSVKKIDVENNGSTYTTSGSDCSNDDESVMKEAKKKKKKLI